MENHTTPEAKPFSIVEYTRDALQKNIDTREKHLLNKHICERRVSDETVWKPDASKGELANVEQALRECESLIAYLTEYLEKLEAEGKS